MLVSAHMDSCVGFAILAALVVVIIRMLRTDARRADAIASLEARLERLERRSAMAQTAPAAAMRHEAVAADAPPAEPTAPEAAAAAAAEASPLAPRPVTTLPPVGRVEPPPPPPAAPPLPDIPPTRPTDDERAPERRPKIEWERFIGIRGFAVLGGAVLALAALLFVKEIADRGYFPPAVRVTLALLAGAAAIAGGEVLRPRGYRATADALAGAGVVILYAATWAAARLFALIPFAIAFALMALVTATAGLLAWRHRSRVIAGLGLAGGFATPLLLETGFDQPLGLFGYLLLLDGGAVLLLRRRGWPLLAGFGLMATVIYLGGWIVFRLSAGDGLLALALLGLFAGVFGCGSLGGGRRASQEGDWSSLRSSALLLPFAGAAYLASRADLGEHVLPIAALLLLVTLAIGLLEQAATLQPGVSAAAAAAAVAVIAVWSWQRGFDTALAAEISLVAIVLAGLHLGLFERARRRGLKTPGPASALPVDLAAGGLLLILVLAAPFHGVPIWPWLAGWIGVGAVLLRSALATSRPWIFAASNSVVVCGLIFFFVLQQGRPLGPAAYLGMVVAMATVLQAAALQQRAKPGAATLGAGALAFAATLLGWLLPLAASGIDPEVFLATLTVTALLVALQVTERASGEGYLALTLAVAAVLALWDAGYGQGSWLALSSHLALVIVMALWPFSLGRGLADRRFAIYAAAVAGPLAFLPLRQRFEALFGDRAIGLLPLGLAVLALATAWLARRAAAGQPPAAAKSGAAARSQVWLLAVSLGFIALAVPLQLSREWWTIAWALQGAAMLALWRRFDHPGLKYFAVGLLAAASLRLVVNPAVLTYHQAGGWPVINWLLYTYLLPAAALLVAARLLADLELARVRGFETPLYAAGKPRLARGCALAAIAVTFVWINLTVFDAFAGGPRLVIAFDRQPARDLTLSLAWALYALILLVIALRRTVPGLRWISLGILVLTILKVFLYDLGQLAGLYRVASLVGLAGSLLLVSLLYQRFVFRRRSPP